MTQPTVTPGAPTQVRFSARAVLRTIVQVGIPALIVLGGVVPEIVRIVLEQLGEAAPSWLRAALLGTAAVVTGTAAAIARIMAIPAVEAWLRSSRLLTKLAAEPTPVPPTDVEPPSARFQPGGYLGRMDAKHDAAHHNGQDY